MGYYRVMSKIVLVTCDLQSQIAFKINYVVLPEFLVIINLKDSRSGNVKGNETIH